jgi:pyruvate formate lyase activating enzyme
MKVGIQKGSFQDSPSGSALVLFLPTCNIKCNFCYNHDLPKTADKTINEALKAIRDIRSINNSTGEAFHTYDWVIVSGGECLLNIEETQQFLEETRRVSNGDTTPIKTGIYTNGTQFDNLKELVSKGLCDYVHLDLKLKHEDLPKYGFSEKDISEYDKSLNFLLKTYAAKKLEYLKFSTVLTKQIHTLDYVVDMISAYGKLFPVQPTYIPKDQSSKDKFLWEFTDFFDNNGEIKVLDPNYNSSNTTWDISDRKELSRLLRIVNTFKSTNTQPVKKTFNFHPEYYNKGKKGYDFYTLMKEIYGVEAYKNWLQGSLLKHMYCINSTEDEILNLKKIKFYNDELLKVEEDRSKED